MLPLCRSFSSVDSSDCTKLKLKDRKSSEFYFEKKLLKLCKRRKVFSFPAQCLLKEKFAFGSGGGKAYRVELCPIDSQSSGRLLVAMVVFALASTEQVDVLHASMPSNGIQFKIKI